MRILLVGFLTSLVTIAISQQRPFINAIDKASTTSGETVTISGSGFNPGNMQVNFGLGIGTITNSTTSLISVTVPPNATYGLISVLDKTTGLYASSIKYFSPAFSGGAFDATAVGPQDKFATGQNYIYDVCGCDFDGDGKIDFAAANNNSINVSVFRNTSTLNTTSFVKQDIANGYSTISTECSDLNGDGKPELVFVTNAGINEKHVFIYTNNSTIGNISFTKTDFSIPDESTGEKRNPRKFRIGDLDGDGKRDLIIGNEKDNTLFIYTNKSTLGGAVTFDTPFEVVIPDAPNVGVVDIADLNEDGLLDIITFSYAQSDDIHIIKNESSAGALKFNEGLAFGSKLIRLNVTVADFDGDGLKEIATSSSVSDEVEVLKNTSTANTISFGASATNITGLNNPWGLEAADVNGDGKVDINIASTQSGLYVLENTSTGSAISFTTKLIAGTGNRNLTIADVNGDAKLDFIAANASELTLPGQMLVVTNRNCFAPTISPKNLTFCVGNAFNLSTIKTTQATYNWSVTAGSATINSNGTSTTSVTVNAGTSANIKVIITSNDGLCTNEVTETFTLIGGTPQAVPSIQVVPSGIICAGTDFTLTGTANRDNYIWTLPDGSEISQTSNVLTFSNASSANAGIYKLRVQPNGGCVSEIFSRSVSIDEPPVVSISNNGTDIFCANTTVELEVPSLQGFTYQWKNGGNNIPGQITNKYTASTTGNYSVDVISNISSCANESATYTVTSLVLPNSSFISVNEICVNVETPFTATSIADNGFGLSFDWDFGDGKKAVGKDTLHTFATAGTFTTTLITKYVDVDNCFGTTTKNVKASAIPTVAVILPAGAEKCPSDSLRLELPTSYRSFNWSTGSTEYFTYGKTSSNEETVTVTVDMVTDIGCAVQSAVTVGNFMNSRLIISSPHPIVRSTNLSISKDSIILENGASTVELRGENGVSYDWAPSDILKFLSDDNVLVYPKNEYTLVSVTGPDVVNNCETTASVVIKTPGVIPRKSFSPNDDGQGFDCWEILNTDKLDGCTVYVFDSRGSTVFKGNSPFADNCVWNGNLDNGSSPAPEGIYYFVMKCSNSRNEKSGAILLAR
jgi:gliding motility-associated-like protein